MEKNNAKITRAISWFTLLYFVILFAERVQSIIPRSAENGLFSTAFDGFVNLTVVISLCATVIMLAFCCRDFFRSLFTDFEPNWSTLTITCGVILVSGMVHTEHTIPGIQFAAYGMLIVAMILRTIQLNAAAQSRLGLWYSLVYLTVFSMAIPVVYHSEIEHATLFHVMETVIMLLMVFFFTVMLHRLFIGNGENLLMWLPFVVMVAGDASVLVMRWNELINTFVLIFASLAALMFIVGKIILKNKGAAA